MNYREKVRSIYSGSLNEGFDDFDEYEDLVDEFNERFKSLEALKSIDYEYTIESNYGKKLWSYWGVYQHCVLEGHMNELNSILKCIKEQEREYEILLDMVDDVKKSKDQNVKYKIVELKQFKLDMKYGNLLIKIVKNFKRIPSSKIKPNFTYEDVSIEVYGADSKLLDSETNLDYSVYKSDIDDGKSNAKITPNNVAIFNGGKLDWKFDKFNKLFYVICLD